MSDAIPGDLEQFLRLHVESFDELYALLLVATEPRPWTVEALAQSLGITPLAAESSLRSLGARGLVTGPSTAGGAYRYAPVSEAADRMVRALAVARTEQPLALTTAMNAQAMDRFRQAALRAFAEGFRLRGPGNA